VNLLAITQKANKLAGIQGSIISLTTLTGYQAILLAHVQTAYEDIQNYRDEWHFLKTQVTIPLTTVTSTYDPADAVAKWDFFNILYDSKPLQVISYDQYIQDKISTTTAGAPSVVAVDPSTNILYFNPLDNNYSIVAKYWNTPETLSGNNDIPLLPYEFHNLIVYRSVADFAAFLGNTGLYQIYTQKANTMFGKLLRSQNPSKHIKLRRAV